MPPLTLSSHAIDMAKKLDASLTVLCIASPSTYMDFGYANVGKMNEIESIEKKRAQREVDKVKKRQWIRALPLKPMFLLKLRQS